MKFRNLVPVEIAVYVDAPVTWDKYLRAIRRKRITGLLHERLVARFCPFHPVEEPFPAKHVKGDLEPVGDVPVVREPFTIPIALGNRRPAHDAVFVPEIVILESCLQLLPFAPELLCRS